MNHFAGGAGPERSTWNIDLARAANGCESAEFFEEMAGSSLFHGDTPLIEDFLVPTRRRRRKE